MSIAARRHQEHLALCASAVADEPAAALLTFIFSENRVRLVVSLPDSRVSPDSLADLLEAAAAEVRAGAALTMTRAVDAD